MARLVPTIVLWVYILPCVFAQNRTTNTTVEGAAAATPTSFGTSSNGSNYVQNGTLYFSKLPDSSSNFSLRAYLDEINAGWTLGPYVEIAKSSLLNLVKIDWDLIRDFVFTKQVPTDLVGLVKKYVGAIVLLAFGLVAGLLFWLIGLCFCCCRCCGKCGGTFKTSDARKQSKKWGLFVLVVVGLTCIFLIVGAGSLYTVGNRIPMTPKHIMTVTELTIADAITYTDVVFLEMKQVAERDLNFTIDVIVVEVDRMPEVVTAPFMSEMRPSVEQIVTAISSLKTVINNLRGGMSDISDSIDAINQINTKLQADLQGIKTTLNDIKNNKCPAASGGSASDPPCSDLPDGSVVPEVFDFSDTPDLSEQTDLLDDATALDLDEISDSALETFEDIPELVDNSTKSVRAMVKSTLRGIQYSIVPLIHKAEQSFSQLPELIEKSNPTESFAAYTEHESLALAPKAFMGVAAVVIIIVLLCAAGVVLGLMSCKTNPEERGKTGKFSHFILMLTVFLAFLFMPIYMIPGSLLFGVGAPFNMICAPLLDLSIFTEIIDHPESPFANKLGKMLFPNSTDTLGAAEVLKNCRDNQAVYKALKLRNLINFEDKVNIQEQMPNLSSIKESVNEQLDSVTILDDETFDDFSEIVDSKAGTIDADDLMEDIIQGVNDLDLSGLISTLDDAADNMQTASYNDIEQDFRDMSDTASDIQNNDKPLLSGHLTSLKTQIAALPGFMEAVLAEASVAYDTALAFQNHLSQSGGALILAGVTNFMNGIINFAEQFVDHVMDKLNNQIGKCSIVWDVYDGMVGSICSFFLDAYNGFWLSLCIIGTFLIVYVIAVVKMVNYFRTDLIPDEEDDQDHDVRVVTPQQAYDSAANSAATMERYE